MSITIAEPPPHRIYFDDGNLEIRFTSSPIILKVHRGFVADLSAFYHFNHGEKVLLKLSSHCSPEDVEALFMHLYHIRQDWKVNSAPSNLLCSPISSTSSFQSISKVLRAAHELSFPQIFRLAEELLSAIYPADLYPLEYGSWHNLREATQVCLHTGVRKPLKPLFYALITTSDFDVEDIQKDAVNEHSDEDITRRCIKAMKAMMDYFTPILFTPPPTSHMVCTDGLAGAWMPLVLAPAIKAGGVYKPLETLKAMREVDWDQVGVCGGCQKDKENEWSAEAAVIWQKLDGWLELPVAQ